MSSRFPVIDPKTLGPLTLVELRDEEALIKERMNLLKEIWTEYDPPLGAAYDVEALEFDPLKIAQVVGTNFEITAYNFVNQMARATTLAFAWGDNLDAIASRYPGGVPRLNKGTAQEEDDERYRRRIWLSANAFTTAGAEEAYVYHALTAVPELRDATATVFRESLAEEPIVTVTIMQEGPDPIPTMAQLLAVQGVFNNRNTRPASDVVAVAGPEVIETDYSVRIWAYPGTDQASLKTRAETALRELADRQRWLGHDHTLMAIYGAMDRLQAQNTDIVAPLADIIVSPRQVVKVDTITVEVVGYNE